MSARQAYYTRLAPHYDRLPPHRPDCVRIVARALVRALRLQEADLLVDLGCGTGLFSREIVRQRPLQVQIVAIDASQAMLDRLCEHSDGTIRAVAMDAIEFAEFPVGYDKILIKDAVGEFGDPGKLFRRIRERVRRGGRLLVAETAPDSQTWLFKEARRRWEALARSPDEVAGLMEPAGFRVVTGSLRVAYRVATGDLLDMVYRRCTPVLATFDDAELRAGADEIRERSAGRTALELTDRFDLVLGVGT